ncbi:hypothetical protein NMY22_g13494 [Coprinellus aureogranulatus]|nr:hypothetical protein NMY22_g13494 [Coprinellus aureogranulatus]
MERDWCAILKRADTTLPDEPKLVQRVFALNEVLNDEGVPLWKPKRVETATAADLLKDIDTLRDKLDEISDSDLTLHSITTNILTYLKVCKNKDPRDFNFLLSIAANNVVDEVKIMTSLKKDRAPRLHLYASTMWAHYQVSGEHRYLESTIQYWHKALEVDPRHADAMADLASALWM